jgi:Kef-type K+ transport system membrane component KefB
MDNIFLQTSALLGITISIAFVIRFLRQPLLIAYIVAGMVAGPLFLNLIHGDTHLFDAFAEFGVVLLLFVVGLSLNFDHIRKIGKVSVVTALTQVMLTAGAGYFILTYLGFEQLSSMYLALAITFSSTVVIVKLLADKKDTQSVYGRHVIGLMVVQDLIALTAMLLVTSLGDGAAVQDVLVILLLKILALAAFVYLLTKFVLPVILNQVADSSEFLFIFTVAWCFGVASVLYMLGFPVEIGAIVAGLSLGSSPYQSEISSRIKPLRDFFIVLFFIILGSQMQIANLSEVLVPALVLSAFILFGNSFILYRLFRLSKFTRRNSFLAGVTAAQVSEFGFVLLFVGMDAGHLVGIELPLFTIIALVTIFISTYVITYNEQLYQFLVPAFNFFGKDKYQQLEKDEEPYTVWVFGYHRIGWKVVESLIEKKIRFAVVDFDPKAVKRLKARGIHGFFGDAADVEFLESIPLEKAKMIISTLPESDDQVTLIKHVRDKSKKPYIIANLYENKYLEDLYEAGADYVMMPHLLGGSWVSNVIKNDPWTKRTFSRLRKDQKEEMKLRFTSHGISE